MNKWLVGSLACLGAVSISCGGAAPSPATPAPAVADTAPAPAAASASSAAPSVPAAWSDDLPKMQKAAFMKANVAPRMSKVFQAASAQHYADFSCKTCHGPEWKSPKDFLPKLTFKDNKLTAFAEKPEVAKFMAEKVVPEMASILGKPPFDPATKKGFGCMGCHTVEMK